MELYIPTLLILTFIVFMVAPDITYLVYIVVLGNNPRTPWFKQMIWMTYGLSFTSDVTIYVFFMADVRKELKKRLIALFK